MTLISHGCPRCGGAVYDDTSESPPEQVCTTLRASPLPGRAVALRRLADRAGTLGERATVAYGANVAVIVVNPVGAMSQGLRRVPLHGPPVQPTNTEPGQGTAVTGIAWN
jgi:hypothetical protein